MFNWILIMFGLGPVHRAIRARLHAAIRAAEGKLVEDHKRLDTEKRAEIEALEAEYSKAKDEALDDIIVGLLGKN